MPAFTGPIRFAFLWLLLLPVFGCGAKPSAATAEAAPGQAAKPAADPIAIRVAPLSHRDMTSIHRTSGTLRPYQQAPVPARAAGIIREILVEEGSVVKKDQLLARLEDDSARLAAEKARVDLEVQEHEYARAEQLSRDQLMSAEEFGRKKADLAQARAANEQAALNLAWTQITAPFAGVVTKRQVDRGATVSTFQAVFELADLSRLYADVPLPEATAAHLRAGASTLMRPVSSSEPVVAKIERIAPAVDAATGTVKTTLIVAAAPGLKPGGFVEVEVVTDTHSNVAVVPREALLAESDKFRVFTVVDNKAKAILVKSGFESDGLVEIAPLDGATTLKDGMPIVVSGAAALAEGTDVKLFETDAKK